MVWGNGGGRGWERVTFREGGDVGRCCRRGLQERATFRGEEARGVVEGGCGWRGTHSEKEGLGEGGGRGVENSALRALALDAAFSTTTTMILITNDPLKELFSSLFFFFFFFCKFTF